MGVIRDLSGLIVIVDISFFFQLFDEIPHTIFVVRKLVFLVQLVHPLERFSNVPIGIAEQLHKNVQQLVEFRLAFIVRIVLFKMKTDHIVKILLYLWRKMEKQIDVRP